MGVTSIYFCGEGGRKKNHNVLITKTYLISLSVYQIDVNFVGNAEQKTRISGVTKTFTLSLRLFKLCNIFCYAYHPCSYILSIISLSFSLFFFLSLFLNPIYQYSPNPKSFLYYTSRYRFFPIIPNGYTCSFSFYLIIFTSIFTVSLTPEIPVARRRCLVGQRSVKCEEVEGILGSMSILTSSGYKSSVTAS